MKHEGTIMPEPVFLTAINFKDQTARLPLVARKALEIGMQLRHGTLDVGLPDGSVYKVGEIGAGANAVIEIHDYAMAKRVFDEGEVGVGESYLRGEWSSPDITAFLELFCRNHTLLATKINGNPLMAAWHRLRHWMNRNSKQGSKRNIAAHYDLGNGFYEHWLDPSMTYSSGLYADGINDLSEAQRAKYAALADETGIEPGHHVLEIGCGWGGFAEYLACERGARVTALTISQAQHDYAVARIERAGLSDRVTIALRDYRDESGVYDRIVSVEMFEAVGEAYWPTFFDGLARSLKPGGRAGLQVITIQDRLFDTYRHSSDFIQQYVFPGGMLPPPSKLFGLAGERGLEQTGERIFGHDYARTLVEWRQRFIAAWPQLSPMGFDERFRRLWEYYLHYCEAGFRSGNIDVRHIVYAKTGKA